MSLFPWSIREIGVVGVLNQEYILMTKTVVKAVSTPDAAVLPVAQSEEVFPVHRIYCVGRNYAAHAVEMGHDPDLSLIHISEPTRPY